MSSNVLWQLQLSAYDRNGNFILTTDSNWQVFVYKMRELVKLDAKIHADVIVPMQSQCIENMYELLVENKLNNNVTLLKLDIVPNALVTRYDFDWEKIKNLLAGRFENYTHVYINDPMLMRHYRALFHVAAPKAKPLWILQVHFLDSPLTKVVDDPISYWHGIVEACVKSDVCLWHCESQKVRVKQALELDYASHISKSIMDKSLVWKSGYSIEEVRRPINLSNIRFNTNILTNKKVVWVPNRVGGLGKSLDYTNNGKFLFEIVPELWKKRQDFVVVAGNPNQKISNDEIAEICPTYVKLVDGALNRDEYRWLAQRADVVVGLYTIDENGGLAPLEAIEFGAAPLFPNVNEYKIYFDSVQWPNDWRVDPDLSNCGNVLSTILDEVKDEESCLYALRKFIRQYTTYKETTRDLAIKLRMI